MGLNRLLVSQTAKDKALPPRACHELLIFTSIFSTIMGHRSFAVYREMAIHAVAWLSYLMLQVLALNRFENQYVETLLAALSQLPAQLLFTYLTLYWLLPTYLLPGRHVQFGWLVLLVLAGCSVLYWQGFYYWFLPRFRPQQLGQETPWDLSRLLMCAFYLLCTCGMLMAFYLIRYGIRQRQLNQQLVIANQAVELKSLKDQINPHFLFNTLNNLYGLTSSNPEKAGEVVLRLSQLMQYMLYEGNLSQVPLQKEITYLQNYLALERIRYGPGLQLSFQINGAIERVTIAPLLLLPFVENAFKHGLSQQLNDAWLQIHLTMRGDELTVKVENSKPPSANAGGKAGLGLPNVAKRLNLLYPGRHQLRQRNGTDSFLTTLTLTLTPVAKTPAERYEDSMPAR